MGNPNYDDQIQLRLNQQATQINKLKNNILQLESNLKATQDQEKTSRYIYPSSTQLEREIAGVQLQVMTLEKQLTLNEAVHNVYGVVQFQVDDQFVEGHPDPTKQTDQIEANRLALDVNRIKNQITVVNNAIAKTKEDEQSGKNSTLAKAQAHYIKMEQEARAAEAKATANAGDAAAAAFRNVATLSRQQATDAEIARDAAKAAQSSGAKSQAITDLEHQKAALVTDLTKATQLLGTCETSKKVFGVATQNRPTLDPDATSDIFSRYLATRSDIMDLQLVPSAPPPPSYDDATWDAMNTAQQSGHLYDQAKYQASNYSSVISNHLIPDEFADPRERTWTKMVNATFSLVLFTAVGYGAWKYVGYEDGTASAEDALLTLTFSTYAVAGLAVAYALLIGYAALHDKIEADAKLGVTRKVYNSDQVAKQNKKALRWGFAGFMATIGFAVISAFQSDDLNVSTTGMLFAPIAAILFALSMNALREADIAAKTEKDYKPTPLIEKAKQNVIGVTVAALVLAIVYNGAVGMSLHKGDAEALGEDIKFMTRSIALLFALFGLAAGYQKMRDSEDAAVKRKQELSDLLHSENTYLYNDNGVIKNFDKPQTTLGPAITPKPEPMVRIERRTDARIHFFVGASSLLIFGILAVISNMAADQKIAATMLAALAGISFNKWGANMEKYHDKIGRMTIDYDTKRNPDASFQNAARIRHTT